MSLLQVEKLSARYGRVEALHDCTLSVEPGEFVALLGANGAGKTTTLRALSGLISARGTIRFDGSDIGGDPPDRRVARGLLQIPDGRGTFTAFTVDENLSLGAQTVSDRRQIARDKDRWYAAFPRLAERRRQVAGSLSGGEQQMLALARALMARPKLLMCDEPSLGLAPAVTHEIFELFRSLASDGGTALIVVEQNADLTLRYADRAYVMQAGQIVDGGAAADMLRSDDIQRFYLGT